MQRVYDWTAKRAGGAITVDHSTGKLTGISSIHCEGGLLVAMRFDGVKFHLAFQSAPVGLATTNTRPVAGCIETPGGDLCATINGIAQKCGFSTTSAAVDWANYHIETLLRNMRQADADHHPI